jgi:EmrB/QacA subfamily drug resistance transporter
LNDSFGQRKHLGLIAVYIGSFMLLLDLTVINVALPDIQQALAASFSDLQWLIDAYALSLAAFLLVAGSLGDRIGRRKVFLSGVLIFVLFSLTCAMSSSPGTLIWSRALQGVGGAFMLATAPALIAQEFTGRARDVAFAAFGGVTGLAIASGPIIGGALTSISWTWIFWLNLPLGIACVGFGLAGLRDRPLKTQTGRYSWVSALILCPALFLVIFGFTEAGRTKWDSLTVLTLIGTGVVLLGVVIAMQQVAPIRMFDAGLLKAPTFLGLGLGCLFIFSAVFPMLLFAVLYFQRILGYSAFQTGLRLLPFTLALFVGSSVAGAVLLGKVSRRVLVTTSLLVTGVGLILLRLAGPDSNWTILLPGMIVAGLGVGVFNPVRAEGTVALVEEQDSGMASGLGSTLQELGVALGVAFFGSLFSTTFASSMADHGLSNGINLGSASQQLEQARSSADPALHQMYIVATQGFIDAWDQLALLTGLTCIAAGVLAWFMMHERDFLTAPADPSVAAHHPAERIRTGP